MISIYETTFSKVCAKSSPELGSLDSFWAGKYGSATTDFACFSITTLIEAAFSLMYYSSALLGALTLWAEFSLLMGFLAEEAVAGRLVAFWATCS